MLRLISEPVELINGFDCCMGFCCCGTSTGSATSLDYCQWQVLYKAISYLVLEPKDYVVQALQLAVELGSEDYGVAEKKISQYAHKKTQRIRH